MLRIAGQGQPTEQQAAISEPEVMPEEQAGAESDVLVRVQEAVQHLEQAMDMHMQAGEQAMEMLQPISMALEALLPILGEEGEPVDPQAEAE